MIDNSELQINKILDYLTQLFNALTSPHLDFIRIKNIIDRIIEYDQDNDNNYLNHLLYPEKYKGIKIPNNIPLPTNAFQYHNYFTIKPNQKGNFAFICNPVFLANSLDTNFLPELAIRDKFKITSVNYLTSFFINTNENLDGISDNNHFRPLNIQQSIPNIYEQYRLVSAAITVKYTGRLDKVSGILGASILYDKFNTVGCQYNLVYSSTPPVVFREYGKTDEMAKYGNFDLALDGIYHNENKALDGIRAIFFPSDNSYEEFIPVLGASLLSEKTTEPRSTTFICEDNDKYKTGFNFFFYGLGTPSEECFKVDIYCNFECLPNSEYTNYLPINTDNNFISNNVKQLAIKNAQKNAIQNLNSIHKKLNQRDTKLELIEKKFKNNIKGLI